MEKESILEKYHSKNRSPLIITIVFWTIVIIGSLAWNLYVQENEIIESARIEARISIRKDIIYRYWSASHGGVYVPVDESTPPNPYLTVPFRDLDVESGNQLTLVNPAYMTRQVHEIAKEHFDVEGHITSLNPIRPANAPDEWETDALELFEEGFPEYSSVVMINDLPHLRLMIPLVTQAPCLQCHAQQGYEVGDVRGGISAAVPLIPLREIAKSHIIAIIAGHSIIWIIGFLGILFTTRIFRMQQNEREKARLEEQKRTTAYLLAASIAHEFNNPLGVIQASIDLMAKKKHMEGEDLTGCQDRVQRQVTRMKTLVQHLLKLETIEEIDYAAGMKILNINPKVLEKKSEVDTTE